MRGLLVAATLPLMAAVGCGPSAAEIATQRAAELRVKIEAAKAKVATAEDDLASAEETKSRMFGWTLEIEAARLAGFAEHELRRAESDAERAERNASYARFGSIGYDRKQEEAKKLSSKATAMRAAWDKAKEALLADEGEEAERFNEKMASFRSSRDRAYDDLTKAKHTLADLYRQAEKL